MRSSDILNYAHDPLKNFKLLHPDLSIPKFIEELLLFGKCVYFIERYSDDTELIFETNCIDRWNRSISLMNDTLNILLYKPTGIPDKVDITFIGDNASDEKFYTYENNGNYYANILISGGADSLCGAYHWVRTNQEDVVFTHTYHKSTPSISTLRHFVTNDLGMLYFEMDGLFNTELNFREAGGTQKQTDMNLNQTRTLIYLLNAIPVNYFLGIDKIYITENGPFTVNPVFHLSHRFTNTTNPRFVISFNQFLSSYLGGSNLIKAQLPFRDLTKAELQASVPSKLLKISHSCSKNSNNRNSCFDCYACYVRRFSNYAFENYDDDDYDPFYYKPDEDSLERYTGLKEDNIFSNTPESFSKNKTENFLISFLKFCFDTIRKENGSLEEVREFNKIYNRRYPLVIQKCREIGRYYRDNIWGLLKRYSEDIIAGIYRFFEKFPEYKNYDYYVYNTFLNNINTLISDGIIEENYYNLIKERIINRGIRGNIRE